MRNTKQKQIIAELVAHAERPLTIQEILQLGQKKLSKLGIATVYREVNRLLESNDIKTVSIPGDPPRYEQAQHHHHHFKCQSCDKVYELEGCSTTLNKMVPKGFKTINHDLTFFGLCKICA